MTARDVYGLIAHDTLTAAEGVAIIERAIQGARVKGRLETCAGIRGALRAQLQNLKDDAELRVAIERIAEALPE